MRALLLAMALSRHASASSASAPVPTKKGHEAPSKQQKMLLPEANRTEQFFACNVPGRLRGQKKSRYHRYGKMTGMKAVGRIKAYSYSRRDQCKLLNWVWEARDHKAISHKGYQHTGPLLPLFDPIDERPEIQAISHSRPMYASLTGTCFASSQQLFKETGRKFRHRRVSWEDMRHRLQVYLENFWRMLWILWFNEALAMRWVFCDESYVSYDEKPLLRENKVHSKQRVTICTYVDSARPLPPVEVLFKAAPNWRDWRGVHEDPAIPALKHVQTQCKGSYRASDMVDYSEKTLAPCGPDYESQVICLDWLAPHMDPAVAAVIESRGHVLLLHVGGTTGYEQIHDTHLHATWLRRWRNEFRVAAGKQSVQQKAE